MARPASGSAEASNLILSATVAALLRGLVQKQVLRADDVRELYETALLLLEQQQGELPGETAAFEAARAAIEQGLLRMLAGGGGAR
jgi:cytochrome c-type biogenesis protein CcmH/NrfG